MATNLLCVMPLWEHGSEEQRALRHRLKKVTDANIMFARTADEMLAALASHGALRVDGTLMSGVMYREWNPDPGKPNDGYYSLGNAVCGGHLVPLVRRVSRAPVCMFSADEDMNAEGMRLGADFAVTKKEFRESPNALKAFLQAADVHCRSRQ